LARKVNQALLGCLSLVSEMFWALLLLDIEVVLVGCPQWAMYIKFVFATHVSGIRNPAGSAARHVRARTLTIRGARSECVFLWEKKEKEEDPPALKDLEA
jgi:hypothetical protein